MRTLLTFIISISIHLCCWKAHSSLIYLLTLQSSHAHTHTYIHTACICVCPAVSLSPLWCQRYTAASLHSMLITSQTSALLSPQLSFCSFSNTHLRPLFPLLLSPTRSVILSPLGDVLKMFLKVKTQTSHPPPFPLPPDLRCLQAVTMCQGRSCSPADRGGLTSQTSPTTPSICGAS